MTKLSNETNIEPRLIDSDLLNQKRLRSLWSFQVKLVTFNSLKLSLIRNIDTFYRGSNLVPRPLRIITGQRSTSKYKNEKTGEKIKKSNRPGKKPC